jgi:antirestriction protein ArdC
MDNRQYQAVTDAIVRQLEAGTKPWSPRWNSGIVRPLRINGVPYKGVNTLALWSAAQRRGFVSPYWVTYKGALALGGQVKKGAKSETAYFVTTYDKKTGEKDEHGNDETERRGVFKSYAVFNCDETENLPPHVYKPFEKRSLDPTQRIPDADAYLANVGIKTTEGGGRACYIPSLDEIHLPPFADFTDAPAFYGTAAHEVVHGTGHKTRLDRDLKGFFGDPDYAFEELIAELGAAYIAADLAIEAEPRDDHSQYLASWLKCLKENNRAIFRAAAFAERAAEYVASKQPQDVAEAA